MSPAVYLGNAESFSGIHCYKCTFKLARWLHSLCRTLLSFHQNHVEAVLRKINGYHFGVLCCAWTSGAVFLLNLVITGWAIHRSGNFNGLGTLQEGSCKQSSKLGFWIHLLINILSTALLSASNYAMQCLNSPTRAEIDKAHSKGDWLDVGLISIRNLRTATLYRQILWWALAISTIPLHLLWNSAVFVSLSSQNYTAWVVPSDFALFNTTITADPNGLGYYIGLTKGVPSQISDDHGDTVSSKSASKLFIEYHPSNDTFLPPIGRITTDSATTTDSSFGTYLNPPSTIVASQISRSWNDRFNYSSFSNYPAFITPEYYTSDLSNQSVRNVIFAFQKNSSSFDKLDAQECQKQYRGPITSRRKNVLLVSSTNSTKSSLWQQGANVPQGFSLGLHAYEYYDRLCDNLQDLITPFTCTSYNGTHKSGNRFFDFYNVSFCWSQRTEEHCKLRFSLIIMIVVVICNFVKLVCLTYIAWRQDPAPLITIGDAITSFLEHEDVTTQGICLAKKQIFRKSSMKLFQADTPTSVRWPSDEWFQASRPVVWKPARQRRFASASKGRWIYCMSL